MYINIIAIKTFTFTSCHIVLLKPIEIKCSMYFAVNIAFGRLPVIVNFPVIDYVSRIVFFYFSVSSFTLFFENYSSISGVLVSFNRVFTLQVRVHIIVTIYFKTYFHTFAWVTVSRFCLKCISILLSYLLICKDGHWV